jgi:O-antigen/teichoic acid export membrane protein
MVNVFLGTGGVQGAMLVMHVLMARFVSIEDYATLRQLFLFQAIIIAISFSSLPSSLLFFAGRSESQAEKWKYIKSGMFVVVVTGLLLFLSVYLLRAPIAVAFNNDKLIDLIPWFSIVMGSSMLIGLLSPVLIAFDKTERQVYLSFVVAIVVTVPTILVAYGSGSLQGIVFTLAASNLAAALVVLLAIGRLGDFRVPVSMGDLWDGTLKLLAYMFPLMLAAAVSIIGLKLDHFIVMQALTLAAYSVYSVGAIEIPIFSLVQNSITAVLLPEVARLIKEGQYDEATEIWRSAVYRGAVWTFPIAAFCMVSGRPIVVLLFGQKYVDAGVIFSIFSALAIIRVMTFGLALRALGKTRIELVASTAYIFSSLGGAYLTATYIGLEGVALWVVVNTCLLGLLLRWLTKRVSRGRLDILRVFPARLLAFAGLVVLAVRGLNLLLGNTVSAVSVLTLLINGVAVALLWLLALKLSGGERQNKEPSHQKLTSVPPGMRKGDGN